MNRFLGCLWFYRNQLLLLLPPLLILPLPLLVPGDEALSGYVLLLLAFYWCTEAVPLSVTGLIPVFIYPLLGLLPVSDVCLQYMKDSTMLFVGGIMVALGIEYVNLHKRIALGMLKAVGVKPQWIMFGFALPSWFLSMWISNTATTAMMLAILEALLRELEHVYEVQQRDLQQHDTVSDKGTVETEMEVSCVSSDVLDLPSEEQSASKVTDSRQFMRIDSTTEILTRLELGDSTTSVTIIEAENEPQSEQSSYIEKLGKAMTLTISYSAKIGGLATVTGSITNLIGLELIDDFYTHHGEDSPLNYTTWILFCLPLSILLLLLNHIWLQGYFIGWSSFCRGCQKSGSEQEQNEETLRQIINKEFEDLGRMSFAEVVVAILFALVVLLWFFRDPGFMPGWADLFKDGYVSDSVAAILIVFIMFFFPADVPGCSQTSFETFEEKATARTLLTWEFVQKKFPWSIIFLVGGGYAMALSCEESGLMDWLASQMSWLDSLPLWILQLLLGTIMSILTEVINNMAACAIFMPIFGHMAVDMGKSPIFLMLPTNISLSFAFMLPSASPASAVAFSYDRITIMDMVKAGFVVKIIGVLVCTLAIMTWGSAIFDMNEIPWLDDVNVTTVVAAGLLPATQPLPLSLS